jgi:hypothetical protein
MMDRDLDASSFSTSTRDARHATTRAREMFDARAGRSARNDGRAVGARSEDMTTDERRGAGRDDARAELTLS